MQGLNHGLQVHQVSLVNLNMNQGCNLSLSNWRERESEDQEIKFKHQILRSFWPVSNSSAGPNAVTWSAPKYHHGNSKLFYLCHRTTQGRSNEWLRWSLVTSHLTLWPGMPNFSLRTICEKETDQMSGASWGFTTRITKSSGCRELKILSSWETSTDELYPECNTSICRLAVPFTVCQEADPSTFLSHIETILHRYRWAGAPPYCKTT